VQTRQTAAALCEAVLERVFEAVTHCLFQVGIYIERKDLHGWQSSVKFSNALGQTINNAILEDVPSDQILVFISVFLQTSQRLLASCWRIRPSCSASGN
jgi:hypothetical protein